jgi:hypothetical protein
VSTLIQSPIEDEGFDDLLDENSDLIFEDVFIEDQTSGGRSSGLPYRRPIEPPPPVAFFATTGQGDQSVNGKLDIELDGIEFSESSSLSADFDSQLDIVGRSVGLQAQRSFMKASLAMLGRARSSQVMLGAVGTIGQEIIVKNLSGGEPEETPRYFGDELDPALWPDD